MPKLSHYGPSLVVLGAAAVVLFAGPRAIREITFEQQRANIQLAENRLQANPILEQLNAAYRDVTTLVAPSVVYISTQTQVPGPRGVRTIGSSGSGWIYDARGHIVTNAHVVDGADQIEVQLASGELYPAKLVGLDLQTDIAVIRIDSDRIIPATRGSLDELQQGDIVFAFGSPFDFRFSMSKGVVSGLGRTTMVDIEYQNFIQTDAAINPGNSGGPLTNIYGRVIGMNTAIATGATQPQEEGQFAGIGLAIPIAMIDNVATQLIERGEVERGYMGVQIVDIDRDRAATARQRGFNGNGVEVAAVVAESPADAAGLQRGDIVIAVNGEDVGRLKQLLSQISSNRPGDTIDLGVWRDGELLDLQVTLATLTPREFAPEVARFLSRAGFENLTTLTSDKADEIGVAFERGVLVEQLRRDSPAAQTIPVRSVIVAVQGEPVRTVNEFYARLERAARLIQSGVYMTVRTPEGDLVEVPIS